jgi:hypothetical protein
VPAHDRTNVTEIPLKLVAILLVDAVMEQAYERIFELTGGLGRSNLFAASRIATEECVSTPLESCKLRVMMDVNCLVS